MDRREDLQKIPNYAYALERELDNAIIQDCTCIFSVSHVYTLYNDVCTSDQI